MFLSEHTLEHCYTSITKRSLNDTSYICCAPVDDTSQTLLQDVCIEVHFTHIPLGDKDPIFTLHSIFASLRINTLPIPV